MLIWLHLWDPSTGVGNDSLGVCITGLKTIDDFETANFFGVKRS